MVNRGSFNRQHGLPGFNVIGYVSGNLGLGVMSRNLVRLLLEQGYQVAIYDMSPSGLSLKRDHRTYEKYFVDAIEDLPYAINLFTLPVRDATEFLFSKLADLISRPGAFNVYFPMWELDVLPDIWVKALSLCDLIVAQTDFIRSTCIKYLPHIPSISAEHPLYLPVTGGLPRHFRLPKASTTFIFSFEPRSDIQRKNPYAVIRAFKQAFRTSGNVALVIKINHTVRDRENIQRIRAIKRMCAGDKRIRVMTQDLSYQNIMNLYKCCDVFVSLHRSEGLGLGPMEAMMLGKPVIATGWSGNMSYMDSHSACLVKYKLIPARGCVKCYHREYAGKGAYWADPSIRDAAKWMRRLAGDLHLRQSLGKAAADAMAIYQKKAKRGHFIEKILIHFRLWQQNKRITCGKNGTHFVKDRKLMHGSRGLKTILKFDPDNVEARHRLALAYKKAGNTKEAKAQAHKVFDLLCSCRTKPRSRNKSLKK